MRRRSHADSEVDDTNGGFTTVAGSVFLRTSTCSAVPDFAQFGGDVRGRDSGLQRRGEAAARYLTDLNALVQHGHAVPRNRHLRRQTDELGGRAGLSRLGRPHPHRCSPSSTLGTTQPSPAEIGSMVRSMSLP